MIKQKNIDMFIISTIIHPIYYFNKFLVYFQIMIHITLEMAVIVILCLMTIVILCCLVTKFKDTLLWKKMKSIRDFLKGYIIYVAFIMLPVYIPFNFIYNQLVDCLKSFSSENKELLNRNSIDMKTNNHQQDTISTVISTGQTIVQTTVQTILETTTEKNENKGKNENEKNDSEDDGYVII